MDMSNWVAEASMYDSLSDLDQEDLLPPVAPAPAPAPAPASSRSRSGRGGGRTLSPQQQQQQQEQQPVLEETEAVIAAANSALDQVQGVGGLRAGSLRQPAVPSWLSGGPAGPDSASLPGPPPVWVRAGVRSGAHPRMLQARVRDGTPLMWTRWAVLWPVRCGTETEARLWVRALHRWLAAADPTGQKTPPPACPCEDVVAAVACAGIPPVGGEGASWRRVVSAGWAVRAAPDQHHRGDSASCANNPPPDGMLADPPLGCSLQAARLIVAHGPCPTHRPRQAVALVAAAAATVLVQERFPPLWLPAARLLSTLCLRYPTDEATRELTRVCGRVARDAAGERNRDVRWPMRVYASLVQRLPTVRPVRPAKAMAIQTGLVCDAVRYYGQIEGCTVDGMVVASSSESESDSDDDNGPVKELLLAERVLCSIHVPRTHPPADPASAEAFFYVVSAVRSVIVTSRAWMRPADDDCSDVVCASAQRIRERASALKKRTVDKGGFLSRAKSVLTEISVLLELLIIETQHLQQRHLEHERDA